MTPGSLLIATGALLAAMSVGTASLAFSTPTHAPVAVSLSERALHISWTLACAPYPAQSRRATSLPEAYGCSGP